MSTHTNFCCVMLLLAPPMCMWELQLALNACNPNSVSMRNTAVMPRSGRSVTCTQHLPSHCASKGHMQRHACMPPCGRRTAPVTAAPCRLHCSHVAGHSGIRPPPACPPVQSTLPTLWKLSGPVLSPASWHRRACASPKLETLRLAKAPLLLCCCSTWARHTTVKWAWAAVAGPSLSALSVGCFWAHTS